ncbi:hypothetical protein ACKWTF_004384 [Chironomus riparius]
MEQNNLQSLPDEILIFIFENLSAKTIKACRFVCKRWNHVILDSKVLFQIFKFDFDSEKVEDYKLNRVKRKYSSIQINRCGLNVNLTDFINPYTVHTLELNGCTLDPVLLAKLLKSLTSLQVLIAHWLYFIEDLHGTFVKAKPKLRKLEILYCYGYDVLDLLDINNISTLKEVFIESGSTSNFIKLLDNQNELESLKLSEWGSANFFYFPEVFKFKFRLKSFTVDGLRMYGKFDKLFDFLMLHKKSLQVLKFGELPTPSGFTIYKFIWNNLSIKECDISILRIREIDEWINDNHEFKTDCSRFKKRIHVQKVSFLKEAFVDADYSAYKRIGSLKQRGLNTLRFKLYLNNFCNATHLDLSSFNQNTHINWDAVLPHISLAMKNLKVLRTPEYFDQRLLSMESIYFPNLMELSLSKINSELIKNFIQKHNKTLEKISFCWFEHHFMGDVINEIVNCNNLKLLLMHAKESEIFGIFNRTDLQIIKRTEPWSLNIEFLNHTPIVLKYKFPDDIIYWKDHYLFLNQEIFNKKENSELNFWSVLNKLKNL